MLPGVFKRGRPKKMSEESDPPSKRKRGESNDDGIVRRAKKLRIKKLDPKKQLGLLVPKKITAAKTQSSDSPMSKKLGFAALERLRTVYAVMNILSSLSPSIITAGFAAAGIHPFTGSLPITKESVDELLKEQYACNAQDLNPANSLLVKADINF